MKYKSKVTEVEAHAIISVVPLSVEGELDFALKHGAILVLDNDDQVESFPHTWLMRRAPEIGDYFVDEPPSVWTKAYFEAFFAA